MEQNGKADLVTSAAYLRRSIHHENHHLKK